MDCKCFHNQCGEPPQFVCPTENEFICPKHLVDHLIAVHSGQNCGFKTISEVLSMATMVQNYSENELLFQKNRDTIITAGKVLSKHLSETIRNSLKNLYALYISNINKIKSVRSRLLEFPILRNEPLNPQILNMIEDYFNSINGTMSATIVTQEISIIQNTMNLIPVQKDSSPETCICLVVGQSGDGKTSFINLVANSYQNTQLDDIFVIANTNSPHPFHPSFDSDSPQDVTNAYEFYSHEDNRKLIFVDTSKYKKPIISTCIEYFEIYEKLDFVIFVKKQEDELNIVHKLRKELKRKWGSEIKMIVVNGFLNGSPKEKDTRLKIFYCDCQVLSWDKTKISKKKRKTQENWEHSKKVVEKLRNYINSNLQKYREL